MIQKQQGVRRSRSYSNRFLLSKTDAKAREPDGDDAVARDGKPWQTPPGREKKLLRAFPNLLYGSTFFQAAMARLATVSRFGALAIRLDTPDAEDGGDDPAGGDEALIQAAETIDGVCQKENALWGRFHGRLFGCFLPGKDRELCETVAEKMQRSLSTRGSLTLTMGIAIYPAANFSRVHIFENALKALDHAGFFGPGAVVSFDAVSLNISGDKLYQAGDVTGAVGEYTRGLLLDPANVNLHNSLGVCYGRFGKFEKALEAFETAIWLDAAEVMPVYNKGIVHLLMKDKDKALDYFLQAREMDDTLFETAFQVGRLYQETGDFTRAREALEQAARLNPASGPAFRYLGECFTALKMTDEAVGAYKKAVKNNPNDAAALSALGCLYAEKGENPEICELFCRQSVAISPEKGLYHYRLGKLYLKHNQPAEALKAFQKAETLGFDAQPEIREVRRLLLEKAG